MNATFVQPFVSYTTPTAWSFTLNTESTYDWEREQWAVPINAIVSKVTKVGDQLVQRGRRRALLGRRPGRRSARLGIPLRRDLAVPALKESASRRKPERT